MTGIDAGQTDLIAKFGAIALSRPRVIRAHGEDGPRETLAAKIRERYRLKRVLPEMGDVIEL